MPSRIARDDNAEVVQLMPPSGTPQTLSVDVAGGTATLSAAITSRFIRLQPTVNTFYLPTVSTAVTSSNGHFMFAGGVYDIPMPAGTSKVSVLGVGASSGTCYLSELGDI